MDIRGKILTGLLMLVTALVLARPVFADRFQSGNYTIDAGVVGNSLNGPQGSTSYQLISSGGESVIGNATSGSYKMGQGYVAQLEQSIELNVTPSSLDVGTITPGVSNSGTLTASVRTDAASYTLAVNQDHDLQNGAATIPGVSGSIASPLTWTEGTTKGLGFTLVSTNATAIPAKWSSGGAYAAFPTTSTTFYTRTGYTAGSTDTHTIRVKVDVATTQLAGAYSNNAIWTGTITP